MQKFSSILYNLLKQRDISQKALAEQANTTEATISRYLSSDRMPRVDLVISIAQALNVSTDYLLGLTSIPNAQSLTPEVDNLIACYSQATDNDHKVVWAVLEKYQVRDVKIAAYGQDMWKTTDSAARQKAIKKLED